MSYRPPFRVVKDEHGHFLRIDVCTCGSGREGDDRTCPCCYPLEDSAKKAFLYELGERAFDSLFTETVWGIKAIRMRCIQAEARRAA